MWDALRCRSRLEPASKRPASSQLLGFGILSAFRVWHHLKLAHASRMRAQRHKFLLVPRGRFGFSLGFRDHGVQGKRCTPQCY